MFYIGPAVMTHDKSLCYSYSATATTTTAAAAAPILPNSCN